MLRRLYYLLPGTTQAHELVDTMTRHGVNLPRMHTVAKEGIDLTGLPPANARQTSDFAAKLETFMWSSNLVIFGLSVVLMIGALIQSYWLYFSMGLIVALVTSLGGSYFARKIPKVHLDEFQEALRHGEILVMVDVPHWRVKEVNQVVDKHHPEAEKGGACWTIEALRI